MRSSMDEPTLPRPLSPQRLGAIRKRLLLWYRKYEQPFPWRNAQDPYAALVAAVCAQQTQMSRVLQIYVRWMAAFPTVNDLANASDADALRVWDRAGYPRRALYLHRTAKIVRQQYGGKLPRQRSALEALPGVGPFTAAMVLNFGYGIDAAAVDTNIIRVLGRVVFGDLQPVASTPKRQVEWAAERLLPDKQARSWNAALMDFGAAVCAPTPRCSQCPLTTLCAAHYRFATGERAQRARRQSPFRGSQRELRGLAVSQLRSATGPIPRSVMTDHVAKTASVRWSRVSAAIGSLIDDGLIHQVGGSLHLGSDQQIHDGS